MRFRDRKQAGQLLAGRLAKFQSTPVTVLGLPRGGVVVAYEIAKALRAPLDVWVVRKLGSPWQPELGVGAVSEGGETFLNEALLLELGVTESELDRVTAQELAELQRRVRAFRGERLPPRLSGQTVILVDDGIATGGTMRAAIKDVRAKRAARIVAAVPISPPETAERLAGEADEVVCLLTAEEMIAIGQWYDDFTQVSDEEVVELLQRAAAEVGSASVPGSP
jgi:putative phosphoribosyl transferase